MFALQAGHSQTYVSGGIYSNTTWNLAGSPYIVTGDVVVFAEVELTIDPGVIVKFDAGTGLELRGVLKAIGTITDSIEFTSNLSSPGINSWNGFTVIGTTSPIGVGDQVTMEYCKALYAGTFIDLNVAYHGPYLFKHCYFAFNDKVNHDSGIPITIYDQCLFVSNNDALSGDMYDEKVSNSSFINNINGVQGFDSIDICYFSGNSGIALSPYGSTTGCTIENNNIGVSAQFNAVNNYFVNNRIANNNIGVEILTYYNGAITFTGNTICDNYSYNVKLMDQNNADLSLNCWCSTDSTYIRSKIYDGYINFDYGLVNFMPLADTCITIITGSNELPAYSKATAKIFPNPFNRVTTVQIENPENSNFTLTVYSSYGQIVKQIKNITGKTILLYRDNLPGGLYFLQLTQGNEITAIEKLLITD